MDPAWVAEVDKSPLFRRDTVRRGAVRWGMRIVRWFAAVMPSVLVLASAGGLLRAGPPPFEFNRMIAHWDGYGDPDYLAFVDAAEPEVAQVGFYGAHFWSLVHTPQFGGYPAHFPVRGIEECGDWFRNLNGELHRRGVRVVGHFNIEFLVGEPDGPDGPRGFFKWYRDGWNEDELGPKPVEDPRSFLEVQEDGSPIVNRNYAIGGMSEYWACLRNPAWQEVLKAWVRRGIGLGLDGFMVNYFYRHECHCRHCEDGFRSYLAVRFTPGELRGRFGIEDLGSHDFGTIVSWHAPEQTTPLKLEMLRFSQVSNKDVFDEVFLEHGRSLDPDLLVAQWNHLGDFSTISGDERCLLPGSLWGRDESYLWYSTGGAANFTDLENGFPGDATLQARFIRGAFSDRPFTLGKYEGTRIRAAIAELAANGGAPMGFYTRFQDPAARAEIVRYYQFLKRHQDLYRANRSHAEVALAYPRAHVHRGEVAAVQRFRELGRSLLDGHVLFDVVPDDLLQGEPGTRYDAILTVEDDAGALPETGSRFEAPFTVRVSASRPAMSDRELDLHFVNYNREEPPRGPDGQPSPGGGIHDEKPIPSPVIPVNVRLPKGATVTVVELLTPEAEHGEALPWEQSDERIRFSVPSFKVYAVVRVLFDR